MKDDHVEERVNLLPPLIIEDYENGTQSIATPSLPGGPKEHRDLSSVVSLVINRPTSPNNIKALPTLQTIDKLAKSNRSG